MRNNLKKDYYIEYDIIMPPKKNKNRNTKLRRLSDLLNVVTKRLNGLLSVFDLFSIFYLPNSFCHVIWYLLDNSLPLPEAVNRTRH